MSNNIRTRDGLPTNFVDGLKIRGVPLEITVSELATNLTQGSSTVASTTVAGSVLLAIPYEAHTLLNTATRLIIPKFGAFYMKYMIEI